LFAFSEQLSVDLSGTVRSDLPQFKLEV